MGKLSAFMQPPVTDQTKDVIISERFKNEDGNVQPFSIRVISEEENERLHKLATKPTKRNGVVIGGELDAEKYGQLLVQACTVTPNFKDTELCDFYKTKDPLEVPGRMLTAGEYARLVRAIRDLNGFGEDSLDVMESEAKNS